MKIEVHTDGSCWNGKGGWCGIIVARDDTITDEELAGMAELAARSRKVGSLGIVSCVGAKVKVVSGKEDDTTNNRMELAAIIESIKVFDRPCKLTIVSDSTYAIGVLSGEMKAKANLGMIGEWEQVSQGFTVEWVHMNGHSGNPLNELCDQIIRKNGEKQI